MNAQSAAPRSARQLALELLTQVHVRGQAIDDTVENSRKLAPLTIRDRAFVRLLVATVLRRRGTLDAAIARCLDKPLTPKAHRIQDVLRLGAAQLLILRTPPHAAVAETGALVAAVRGEPYRPLVNAVLRRLALEGVQLLNDMDSGRLDLPDWLWQSWTRTYGEATTRAIASALAQEPSLDISVKTDP